MVNLKKVIYSMHPLERKVLPILLETNSIKEISKKTGLKEAEVTTGIHLLEAKEYLQINKKDETFISLDKFGEKFLDRGLPEIIFLKDIINKKKKQSELSLKNDEIGSALGILKRNNLINISKEKEEMIFEAKKEAKHFLEKNLVNPLKEFKEDYLKTSLSKKQKEIINSFKQRKGFLKEITKKSFDIKLTKQGEQIANEINEKYSKLNLLEAIDSNMLKNESWKNKEFRHYDVKLDTPIQDLGRHHPMMESNNILKEVFVEMGFEEMSGPMVESAFWNMDVMWIPQDHPARDEQDTFYLEKQADINKPLMNKVKEIHEKGIKKTHTQKGEFSEKITRKTLLRTHSTSTSFRTLFELGKKLKKGENVDGKYFYVAPVFRNEAIDATHLAEFFQAEGFIIGADLSLADLMGFIKEYYAKFGIDKIKFKPTFNPYTEPSMEAHYYDEKLKKWYALINSGIFRAETLKAFGLENKRILAWGMGASRVAALLARKESMRDISGNTCDFEWLKTRPMMKREIVRK